MVGAADIHAFLKRNIGDPYVGVMRDHFGAPPNRCKVYFVSQTERLVYLECEDESTAEDLFWQMRKYVKAWLKTNRNGIFD